MNESDILNIISQDEWMITILNTAQSLGLPDWMIGAGFVRSKVWDYLHEYDQRTALGDIDVIYFDSSNLDEDQEKIYEQQLKEKLDAPWSVKNQARMHIVNNENPYISSTDALSRWPEEATCVAVTLDDDKLELVAPHGINDLVNMTIRIGPLFKRKPKIYLQRCKKKQWQQKWPKVKII